jgi:hypothetical protein
MSKTIMFGAPTSEDLVLSVRRKLIRDFDSRISQAALTRILLGKFVEGKVDVSLDDLLTYSQISLRGVKGELPE